MKRRWVGVTALVVLAGQRVPRLSSAVRRAGREALSIPVVARWFDVRRSPWRFCLFFAAVCGVGLAAQHGREEADHRWSANRRAFVVPGAVAGDAHAGMAAPLRIPLIDRRVPAIFDELLELGEAQLLKLDGWTGLRHWPH